MKIKTVVNHSAREFDAEVNKFLSDGWEVYGPPTVAVNSHQDTWEGNLRSFSQLTFVQILKRDDESIPA